MSDVACCSSDDGFDGSMAWVKPAHSRSQVDRAGAAARRIAQDVNGGEDGFVDVIANWRASHSYPLNGVQALVRQHAARADADSVVVQRLKRFGSIINKLVRFPTTQLSQMQDIAGCRAVLKDLPSVYAAVESLRKSKTKHTIRREKDYIADPKSDGYRSFHLIFQFVGNGDAAAYDKLFVEVQLRTQMQHVWATALETVDAFTGQALKANRGNADWQRFFALMGSVVAFEEECCGVPGTPADLAGVRHELQPLARRLNVVETLSAFRATVDYSGTSDGHYYLLRLDPSLNKLAVRKYAANQSEKANADYLATERESIDSDALVVLVSAETLVKLQRAYPNYFPSTDLFLDLLQKALA